MICLLAGTNRPGSNTLKVTKMFEKIYRENGADVQVLSLTDLPPEIFSATSYADKPQSFRKFADQILGSDGIHVFTPEYNGGFPGVLKYFIDMLPFPQSFEKRPVAFTGVAAGMWGALRPVEQLEQIFKYRNAYSFNERTFFPKIDTQITADGKFTTELLDQLVHSQIKNFIKFCAALKPLRAVETSV